MVILLDGWQGMPMLGDNQILEGKTEHGTEFLMSIV
jgi:hypothetical protein